MSLLSNRAHGGYSKMETEDPEEIQHRLAQFLIYKAMQKAGNKRKPSWLRVKIIKLKIKVGKRLKKLRKGFSTSLFSAKSDFWKQINDVLKSCKYLIQGKQGPIIRALPLPAVF